MKGERGSIVLYVTVACLFILIIGITAYIGVSNKQAAQIAALKQIEEEYNNQDVTAEDLYQQYVGGDVVPVYTPEQFAMVGSGEDVYVAEEGKIYTFSTDKTYMFYGIPEDLEKLLGTLKTEIKDEVRFGIVSEAVTAIATDVSIYEGTDNNIKKYFTYNENADDLVTSVVYTDTCHSNEEITNTKSLATGEHTIKCTVTKQSGAVSSAIKSITIKSSGLAKENVTIKPSSSSNVQIVVPAGFGIAILESTGTTTSYPWTSGKVIGIMPQDQWSSITVDQINLGIVVVDNAITYDGGNESGTLPDFNEYVWVPMPDSSSFKRIAWSGPYNNNGTWTNGTHPLAETSTSLAYWEDKTTTEYNNMVSSVNTNKGFYISRYEATVEKGNIAQSKRGQMPRRFVTQLAAIEYSKNNPTPNTHLMYGIEWDSVLNWLIGHATIESSTIWQCRTMVLSDVSTDSRSWGNYLNATGNASFGNGEPKITGYHEYWKANNIYDLAGNLWEWTQERYSTGSYRVYRGGCYDNHGASNPVAYRNCNSETHCGPHVRLPLQLLFVALAPGSDAVGR